MRRFLPEITTILLTVAGVGYAATDFIVSADALKAVVTDYVSGLSDADPEDVSLTFIDLPEYVMVSEPVDTLLVVPGASGLFRGTALLYVGVYSRGVLVRKIPVTVRARILKPVLVSNEMIDRHTAIRPSQVHTERVDATALSGTPLTSVETLAGLRTTRVIAAGHVLLESMVERPPVVRRGDRVAIRVTVGMVTAAAPGQARADGRPGEVIPVKNVESGKELYARVQDAATVVIDTPGGNSHAQD
jgi:flagella basal body P-ring formation protein FlgA